MAHLLTALILAVAVPAVPGELPKVVAVIRNAYEENITVLSASGTIRFHATDGELGPAASFAEIRGLLKSNWKRRSPSNGLFVFNGKSLRYDNLYPPEELIARRVKTSDLGASSPVAAIRLLSDGETTFMDIVDVDLRDNKTILHSPTCYQGAEFFYQMTGQYIPLHLTDPDPPRTSLGRCLRDYMEGRESVVLTEVDESATLDGVAVVKLSFELSNRRRQITFWVDLEHGAIPVQTRSIEEVPGKRKLAVWQENLSDVRWIAKGWLPFRKSSASGRTSESAGSGELSSGGELPVILVRETIVDEADFERRPDSAMFALEFPREYGVNDSNRLLSYGSRRVWTLQDFSPAARARARPLKIGTPSPGPPPAMRNAVESRGWWPAAMAILGLTCLLAAGTLLFRGLRKHAA